MELLIDMNIIMKKVKNNFRKLNLKPPIIPPMDNLENYDLKSIISINSGEIIRFFQSKLILQLNAVPYIDRLIINMTI